MINDFIFNTKIFDTGDDVDDTNSIDVTIEHTGCSLYIKAEGYGENVSQDREGFPIKLELWEGELRLLVWDNINEQDPKIINLEKAKESNRKK